MKMSPAKGMGMMDGKTEMGMPLDQSARTSGSASSVGMKDDQGEMGALPMGNTSLAPAPAMGIGKGASGGNANKSTAAASGTGGTAAISGPSSAMPGQAGISHLYHIGSNGFFLNHSQDITLTQDQRRTLSQAKENTLRSQAAEQRAIDQAEQELFALTGADQADNPRIQAKIAQIEKLRATQRMNFIRAVEDAANVLTPKQRKVLLGTMTAAGN